MHKYMYAESISFLKYEYIWKAVEVYMIVFAMQLHIGYT